MGIIMYIINNNRHDRSHHITSRQASKQAIQTEQDTSIETPTPNKPPTQP